MASTDARPIPLQNTAYRLYLELRDSDNNPVTDWTGVDSERSLDGAAFADCTNEATHVGNGCGYLDLTTTEMNTDETTVVVKLAGAIQFSAFIYPAVTNDIPVNLVNIAGSAVSTTTAQLGVNMVQVSGDSGAADNLETAFDGGAYNVGGGSIVAASVTGAVGSVTGNVGGNVVGTVASVVGAVGSVTGNVGGNVTGSVGSVVGAVGSVTGNVGGNVTGSVGSLATQAKADVNAEVVDCLNVDTYAEPGQGAPAATASIVTKLGYVFKNWRNRKTQTDTTWSLYADDATTVDQKATVANDGTTASKTEVATGP